MLVAKMRVEINIVFQNIVNLKMHVYCQVTGLAKFVFLRIRSFNLIFQWT